MCSDQSLPKNVLLLSAGRRVVLFRGFCEALESSGLTDSSVFAADLSPDYSAACQLSDTVFELPAVNDEFYTDQLLRLCKENSIGLVVPTLDPELPVLAKARDKFASMGIELIVSNENFVSLCNDKRLTAQFFREKDLKTPDIYDLDTLKYPVLVKPFDGSLSKGISIINSEAELTKAIVDEPRNIFCEYKDHSTHTEFTCDLYYDRSDSLKCVVPRERIEVRGGEVSKGSTRRNNIVTELFDKLGQLPGVRGCLTVQALRHNESGALFFIEINARFGGGYPLTREAGADYSRWLIDEYLLGIKVSTFEDWKANLLMLRYDEAVYVG